MDITHIKRYFLSRDEQTRSQQTCPGLKIVAPGENIQVGELEVHVMSAIHRQDYPLPGAFNVLLVGWAYCDSFEQSFVCCLGNRKSLDEMVQVPAKPLFMDNRLKRIPMRYALYSCTVDGSFARESSSGLEGSRFRYVAFSETSCGANMTAGREIASAKEGGKKFGMCTKIAYGYLEPERLVEWFEFAKLIGVDVVQVFYHIVSERAMDVFRYYESTGFVILAPVNPAVMKGHPPRGFLRPRWEEQAWMDGTVICNDCVHRLSQYDFVAIMDFDELLLPSAPHNTLLEVAQAAAGKYPEAAAFFIETYIALLNWPASNNKSSIFFLRYLDHSVSDKLDNFGMGKSSPKLIYRPTRVIAVYTHDLTPAMNFTKYDT
nr:hypothetical protein BaRGS_005324 [Batillaria attramentaria]